MKNRIKYQRKTGVDQEKTMENDDKLQRLHTIPSCFSRERISSKRKRFIIFEASDAI